MEERLEEKEVVCSELQNKSKVGVLYILQTRNFLSWMCSHLKWLRQRLEDLLNNEKKLVSQRRKELAKVSIGSDPVFKVSFVRSFLLTFGLCLCQLHKSYSRVRECTDNLKDCEQELQVSF